MKIDEESECELGSMEIAQYLCFVKIIQLFYGLQFNYEAIGDQQVEPMISDGFPAMLHVNWRLARKRDRTF